MGERVDSVYSEVAALLGAGPEGETKEQRLHRLALPLIIADPDRYAVDPRGVEDFAFEQDGPDDTMLLGFDLPGAYHCPLETEITHDEALRIAENL